uniref:Reverse transcriptase zinc-binding domain-containing protein n=1 Tax=Cannabis sativa TaxID=3483 RepID=A0A803Q8P1_CANSA
MTARIRVWSTRHLSFAGRLVLVKSVLMSIHVYWCQIIFIPKQIIKELEAVFRSFLWTGKSLMNGAGAVAWEKLCCPKKSGGLGLVSIPYWNAAAMVKHAPMSGSWYWRKMVDLKERIKDCVQHNTFSTTNYKIVEELNWFNPNWEKVSWSNEVWSRLNIPKHSFLLWLAMLNKLKTRDRLFKHGYIDGAECIFCNNVAETTNHLFFECYFGTECLKQVKEWLGWHTTAAALTGLLKWVRKARCSSFKKKVLAAGMAALVYCIWIARNELVWNTK